jgi:glycosyltransferase involved in cell wall biosynthesis
MKIAIWHNLPSGGGKRALYYHVRGLVGRDHTVESWCPPTADQSHLPLSEFIPEHVVPLNIAPVIANNRLSGVRALYRGPLELIRALNEHSKRCADEIAGRGFDVLFANTSLLLHAGPIGKYLRIPKVLYLQEPNRPLYEANGGLPWIAPPINGSRWWQPKAVKNKILDLTKLEALRIQAREELVNAQAYDALLVNSFFSRESIARTYGLEAHTCYLGVDTTLFRPLSKEREPFIISVGAFFKNKGIDLAIRSVALIKDRRPSLVWISNFGDPDYIQAMETMAQSLNVKLEIKIRVSEAELVDLLNRAALLVYTPRLEPFGFAPLEANACATPVVAVAEGGVRETVHHGQNGLLVDRTPESIRAAIENLISSPAEARRMGEVGLDYVRREWSLDRSVERLERYLIQYSRASLGHD